MVTYRIDMNIIWYSLSVEGTLLTALCLHQVVLLVVLVLKALQAQKPSWPRHTNKLVDLLFWESG